MPPEAGSEDRLSRMIARLSAQRACLDLAASLVARLPGPVLEVGLGKARTYDRLRHLFPQREVWAFDREVHCPPAVRPPEHLTVLGDFRDSLAAVRVSLGGRAALVHADFGSEQPERDARLASELAPLLRALLAPGGVLVSDRPLPGIDLDTLPPPAECDRFAYFVYRSMPDDGIPGNR